ncbi:MAG: MFS transporter, partial [Pseudomonadota bacterium]
MRTANRLGEFSYAWRIVLASALGIGLGLSPIPIYTLGVFAAPLAAEFEWRIDEVFAALPVLTLCALVLSPVAGLVIDRVGVRRVAIWSVLGFGVGLMAHALNPGSYWLYLATWAFVAILGIGTLPITWTRAINNWFHDCRGLALGFSLVATGFFGVFAKFYVASLIELVGWRLAFVGLGLLPILIALPAAIFFFRDANDSKVPDRVRPQSFATGAGGTPLNAAGLDASVVFQDWRFWLMCVCFVAISFGVGGTIPNLENLFSSKGFGRNDAVKLASLVGLSVVVGRLASGYLIDRVWAPAIAFCMLVPPALSCYLLMDQELTYA